MAPERLTLLPTLERLPKPNRVAVVGARVAGSPAAHYLITHGVPEVVCVDSVDPRNPTTPACTGCGGLTQYDTVELFRSMGLALPPEIIRHHIKGFITHLPNQKTITTLIPGLVSLDRGYGPIQDREQKIGLDGFLLKSAVDAGATFLQARVVHIALGVNRKAIITAKSTVKNSNHELFSFKADQVVGAFGHSNLYRHIDVPHPYILDAPQTIKSAIYELEFPGNFCRDTYGDYVHVVVVPHQAKERLNVWFAAFIPKGPTRVTLVLMGRKDVTDADIKAFMSSPFTNNLLPDEVLQTGSWAKMKSVGGCATCVCQKNTITTHSPVHFDVPIQGGAIFVGDAARTRERKDGIGAAASSAVAAAQAIIAGDLQLYRDFVNRNFPPHDADYARALMRANDMVIGNPLLANLLAALNTHHVPIASDMLSAFMGHLLIGDKPYQNILPWPLNRALMLAFGSRE